MISPARLASAVVHRKKNHGAGCDLAGCAGITDARDTHDNGTEDQWKDHHVQGIHVNASDKACDGKYRFETVCQKQSGNDTKDQTGKDCCGNMFFIPRIEFFICSLLFIFIS